jgi:hypothetical protein
VRFQLVVHGRRPAQLAHTDVAGSGGGPGCETAVQTWGESRAAGGRTQQRSENLERHTNGHGRTHVHG